MSTEPQNQTRLEELVSQLLDGNLPEANLDELRELLRHNDSARETYLEQVVTHAMLQWRQGATSALPKEDEKTVGAAIEATSADAVPIAPTGSNPENPLAPDQAAPGITGSSGITGFLGTNFPRFALFSFLAVLAVSLGIAFHADLFGLHRGNANVAGAKSGSPADPRQLRVARLTTTINSRWDEGIKGLQIGDIVPAGRRHELLSGIAELTFSNGVRLLLQSPVAFSLDSRDSVQLYEGKLTAEINGKEGRGFKVITADGTFTDLGTQFGVEAEAHNYSRASVLKGEVGFQSSGGEGAEHLSCQLLAGSGLRSDGGRVCLVDDSGDSFIRSVDAAESGRHVVAYWRFEDAITKTLSEGKAEKSARRFTVDSSYNGNDLFADFNAELVPSDDVAYAVMPASAAKNSKCFDNTKALAGPASMPGLFTHSSACHAAPVDIQEVSLPEWTIEASIKVNKLDGIQTFVGRSGAATNINVPVRLAFQITQDGCFAISYRDADGRPHGVVANDYVITTGQWYHVTAVSDGRQLTLFVNSFDDRGYRKLATSPLPNHGSTALASGAADAPWTIGFGRDARSGRASKAFNGYLDEIRICDKALSPSEFLFANN